MALVFILIVTIMEQNIIQVTVLYKVIQVALMLIMAVLVFIQHHQILVLVNFEIISSTILKELDQIGRAHG